MPGIPLAQQRKEVMLWIREPFLSDESDHGLYIVHGHTPTGTGMPELCPNRLNLDTLAWYGNPLIAAVFDEQRVGPLAFIADDGSVTAGAGDQPARTGTVRSGKARPRAIERFWLTAGQCRATTSATPAPARTVATR